MKNVILSIVALLFYCNYSIAGWTKINDIPSRKIVVLTVFNDTILAASESNVLYKSADGGVHWDSIVVSNNAIRIITLKVTDSVIYTGTFNNGVFYSTDYGHTWLNSGSGLLAVAAIEKHGNDIYAATLGDGVFILNQNNNNWIPFNDSLPSYSVNVFTMLSTRTTLFIGPGSNGTFYRYDFNIHGWHEEYYDGILHPALQIQKLIGDGDTLFAANGGRIIRSDNNGFSWTNDITGTHNGFYRIIYSGMNKHYTLTDVTPDGTWIQQRSKPSISGDTWANNEEFLPTGFAYDILEFHNKLFLAKADGLYVKDLTIEVDAAEIDTSVLQPNSITVDISTTFNPDSFCVTALLGSPSFSLLNCDSVLFVPDNAFVGNDTCYYVLCDNSLIMCDTGMVVVTVIPDSSLYPVADFTFSCSGNDGYNDYFSMTNASSNDTAGSARWIVHQGETGCDTTTFLSGDTVRDFPIQSCGDNPTMPDVCLIVSNRFGSDSICKTVCTFFWEGIEEIQPSLIHIYPNPVRDFARIVSDERAIGGTVQFTDVTGKEIMRVEIQNKEQQLDVNKFPSGLYFAMFKDKKNITRAFKLVIE